MKNSILLKIVLFISSVLLIVVGFHTLKSPIAMYVRSGAVLPNDVNILNSVRASSCLLLGCGLLIMLGIVIKKLTYTSTLLTILVYYSYGIGRVISILVDGMPSKEIIQATIVEFIVGSIALLCWLKYRNKSLH